MRSIGGRSVRCGRWEGHLGVGDRAYGSSRLVTVNSQQSAAAHSVSHSQNSCESSPRHAHDRLRLLCNTCRAGAILNHSQLQIYSGRTAT